MSAEPIPPILLEPDLEALRVKASVAFMISGALEVQARIAREIDPELHKLLVAAHGHCIFVMTSARGRLQEGRRAFREREQKATA